MIAVRNEEEILSKAKEVMFNFNVSLSGNARFLYMALLVAEGKPLTHTELSEITDIKSPITLRKVIRELQDNRMITVTRLSKGQIYKVL